MAQIIDFPCCDFCRSIELGIFATKNNLMVMCDECGYVCTATIDHFDHPLTKVSVS